MRLIIILLITFACIEICNAEPPKLTATSPAFWAIGVNSANQKVISLTFDQPMRSGFSSWLGRSSVAPSSDAAPILSDNRLTFSLPVGLEAAKVYVFALNEKGIPGVGFQNDKGLTLPPMFLVFQTAGTPAEEDIPPKVVRVSPANGTQHVNSAMTKSVIITFDHAMNNKKHGLHLFENGKPVDISKAPFAYSPDGLTFTFSYKFKPSTEYRLDLNSINDVGFSRSNRIPLWPVRISFTTG
jgi:hypothetical protein